MSRRAHDGASSGALRDACPQIRLEVDGRPVEVPAGANVAAAVARVTPWFRRSTAGARRGPLCGMGVCFECRVRIDEARYQRACMVLARDGMRVRTDD